MGIGFTIQFAGREVSLVIRIKIYLKVHGNTEMVWFGDMELSIMNSRRKSRKEVFSQNSTQTQVSIIFIYKVCGQKEMSLHYQ